MSDPKLVPRNALDGIRVAISVSDSDDLARLGLSQYHCEMAVAEMARAVMIAGGTVVYGGRLVPVGFTDILLDEVRRFRGDREALTICLAQTEHQKLSNDDLLHQERQLSASARLVCLNAAGDPVDIDKRTGPHSDSASAALTAMRRYVTTTTHARVLIGGRLQGFQGDMPGLIEEALLSAEKPPQPLYVAGGFGGASCAVAQALGRGDFRWLPDDCPNGAQGATEMLAKLVHLEQQHGRAEDGLSAEQRHQLAVTHRPADIASLVVVGLARR